MIAGQKSGKKRPRGRPFQPGQPPPVGRPFPPGVSANPGGRPGMEPAFRARCREVAGQILEQMAIAAVSEPETLPDLAKAFEAIADRGGLLPADRDARVLLGVLALGLGADGARDALQMLARAYGREVADPVPALPAAPPDAPK